jgi:iron complex outermembrane receptor protein
MSFKKKSELVAIIASVCAGGVTAQAVSADSPSGDRRLLEEVVVTAQKRGEQNLQDVAISMSVLGGDSLDASRYEGVAEALGQVAGLSLYTEGLGGGTKLSMRGVTAGGSLFSGSSTVGYYLDDTPWGFVTSAVVPDANPYDLDRIEVLRGPQGTLYGASALNGVVRILTKDANLDEVEFKARGSASYTDGADNNYRGDMAVNVPIIPGKLAARLVAGYNDLSGWIDNPVEEGSNDSELSNYRLKVGAQPTDRLTLGFTASYSRADYGAPSVSFDDGTSPAVLDEPMSVDYDVYGFTIDYDFTNFTVRSSTSYIDYSSESVIDIAGLDVLTTNFDTTVFSQELRAVSLLDGPWQWAAGFFYRDAEDDVFQTLPIFIDPNSNTKSSESFAVFGEITRSFMDGQYELTAGLRYFEDDVRVKENLPASGDPDQILQDDKSTFDNVSPRVVLTWYPSEDLTVYGSVSEGFRSGADQSPALKLRAPGFPAVEEDTLVNYEVGTKGTFYDGRVKFDAALYYIDWSDVQQAVSVPIAEGVFAPATVNAGDASGPGIDIGLTFVPIDNLQLGLNVGWNDLTSDQDVLSNGVVFIGKGDRLGDSAETTLGVTFDYYLNLGSSGLEGQFSGSANYTSELVSRTVSNGELIESEGDEILISRLSFAVNSESWSTTVYVDNVGNEDGATQILPGDPLNSARIRPRTAGLQFEYRY